MNRTFALAACFTALLALATAEPLAQSGIVRIIVGTAPGGAIDPYARLVGEHMSRTLGQPIIIENKPGASGTLAAEYIVNAPADGTILWLGTQAFTEINPNAFPNARWSIDQFRPIIRGVEAPLAFVINPSVPADTFADFIAWAKANRGKLSYSSYQSGTPSHFLGFQMNEKFELDLTHVPYRGSGLQVTGLLGGHSLFGFAPASSRRWRPPDRRATALCRTCRHSPNWAIRNSPPRSGSAYWSKRGCPTTCSGGSPMPPRRRTLILP